MFVFAHFALHKYPCKKNYPKNGPVLGPRAQAHVGLSLILRPSLKMVPTPLVVDHGA